MDTSLLLGEEHIHAGQHMFRKGNVYAWAGAGTFPRCPEIGVPGSARVSACVRF